MDVPDYAITLTEMEVHYLANICQNQDENIHLWREEQCVVIRNCDELGSLLDLKLPKTRFVNNDPWILINVRNFTDPLSKTEYQIPICSLCNPELSSFSAEQNYTDIRGMLCHHSRISGSIIRDFKSCFWMDGWLTWEGEEETSKASKVKIFLTKKDKSTKSQTLALTKIKEKKSVLFTVGKMTTPQCSVHSSAKCPCIKLLEHKRKADDTAEEAPNDAPEDNSTDEKVAQHFLDNDEDLGYNRKDIAFPLKRDPALKAVLDRRTNGQIDLPEEMIPDPDYSRLCEHGNSYSGPIKLIRNEVEVYSERGVMVFPSKLFCRMTNGSCKCKLHYDGREDLLYHIQLGTFIELVTLQSFIISFVNSGISSKAYHKSMVENMRSLGVKFDLKYQDWNRACDGYVMLLDFDLGKPSLKKDCICHLRGVNSFQNVIFLKVVFKIHFKLF